MEAEGVGVELEKERPLFEIGRVGPVEYGAGRARGPLRLAGCLNEFKPDENSPESIPIGRMDDEVHIPEGPEGDVGIDVEGQPAALRKGGPEAGPADGLEEDLELAIDLGRPSQVPQEGQAEPFHDGRRNGARIVAEGPIDEREQAFVLRAPEGPVPVNDGGGEADRLPSPSRVRSRT